MDVTAHALETALAELAPNTRPATDTDMVASERPSVVVEPATEEEVAAVLRYANAMGLAVIPRGGGTQLTYGLPPRRADIVLSMARMNQIIEYAPHDLTVTAQAGLTLAALQRALGESRQWLALDPLVGEAATLGGLISTNATGARRLRYGGVRDQIIGVRVALPDGTIARGGGKVVKNVAGYDLPKLYTGALGTLGVILSASFRLYPLPSFSTTALLESERLPTLGAAVQRILALPLTPSALDIFPPEAPGAPYLLAARFPSGVREAVDKQARVVCGASVAQDARPRTPLDGDDDARFWEERATRWRTRASGENAIYVKTSVLPTDVAGWLAELEATRQEDEPPDDWQAHAGHGIIHARLAGTPAQLARRVETLRSWATERRGSLVITDLPPSLAGALDPWGPIGALAIMRNLKERFDPNAILNPGRFVGGI
ncbi:MAG TPA: FAD-binding oxidoreductase [Ktedonobacterales bacterium]